MRDQARYVMSFKINSQDDKHIGLTLFDAVAEKDCSSVLHLISQAYDEAERSLFIELREDFRLTPDSVLLLCDLYRKVHPGHKLAVLAVNKNLKDIMRFYHIHRFLQIFSTELEAYKFLEDDHKEDETIHHERHDLSHRPDSVLRADSEATTSSMFVI